MERAPKSMRKLMPIIEDPNNHENPLQCDSTPILLYLIDRYVQSSKPIFPSSPGQRQNVIDMCLRLDSELGLYARRLTYVLSLKERPSAMAILLGEKSRWIYDYYDICSHFIGPFIVSSMISRYRLHRIQDEHLREKTERILEETCNHLRTNDYLVGQEFSAVDITFCVLIKPFLNIANEYEKNMIQNIQISIILLKKRLQNIEDERK